MEDKDKNAFHVLQHAHMLFAFWNVKLMKNLDMQSEMIKMSAPLQIDCIFSSD